MTEEEYKATVKNFLIAQNNNDHNFSLLQAQIEQLRNEIKDLKDLKEMFRLPSVKNQNREPFEYIDADEVEDDE